MSPTSISRRLTFLFLIVLLAALAGQTALHAQDERVLVGKRDGR